MKLRQTPGLAGYSVKHVSRRKKASTFSHQPRYPRRHVTSLRDIGLLSAVLLTTVTLTLAGACADRNVGLDAATAPSIVVTEGRDSPTSIEAVDGWFDAGAPAVVRARRLSLRYRPPGVLPHQGVRSHAVHLSADAPAAFAFHPAVVLLTFARWRLDFTHDGFIARTAARSSFGTSLPPPRAA